MESVAGGVLARREHAPRRGEVPVGADGRSKWITLITDAGIRTPRFPAARQTLPSSRLEVSLGGTLGRVLPENGAISGRPPVR